MPLLNLLSACQQAGVWQYKFQSYIVIYRFLDFYIHDMNSYLSLKLVMRSWKRNKLFVAISLVSLVVGIACTTLLMAFVIHEYNVENYNPNKNRILRLVQTLPFAQQVVEGTFIYGGTVPQIVSQFPEIESYLRTQTFKDVRVKIEEQEFQSWSLVAADSTLTAFSLSII